MRDFIPAERRKNAPRYLQRLGPQHLNQANTQWASCCMCMMIERGCAKKRAWHTAMPRREDSVSQDAI